MQLHQPDVLKQFEASDAQLVVVSFAALTHLRSWIPYFVTNFIEPFYEENKLGAPTGVLSRTRFVADPELKAYHAYGLGRNSVLNVYGPGIIWQYIKWGVQGKPIKKPNEDTLQRGGDFVVGSDGKLDFSYVGRNQADRPTVAQILAAIKQAKLTQ